jgi:beta-N-acetylhexosaminidase
VAPPRADYLAFIRFAQTSFWARVASITAVWASVDVLLRLVTLDSVGSGGRAPLLPNFDAVGDERPVELFDPGVVAGAIGVFLAVLAVRRAALRSRLLAPVGLLAGAALATLVDVLPDGRVTRWVDPPVFSAVNLADIGLVLACLWVGHGVGVALGGGIDTRRGASHQTPYPQANPWAPSARALRELWRLRGWALVGLMAGVAGVAIYPLTHPPVHHRTVAIPAPKLPVTAGRLPVAPGSRAGTAAPEIGSASERRIIGQHLVYGFLGTTAPAWLIEKIKRGEAAGVLVDRNNIASRRQFRAVVRTLQSVGRPRAFDAPLFVMTDQEGGQVWRLPGAPRAAASVVGRWNDLGRVFRLGVATGRNLRSAGINVTLSPVVDVGRPGSIMAQRGRSYSGSPRTVARTAEAFIEGMRSVGVFACIKHFPGLGSALRDEDTTVNYIQQSLSRLRSVDELPYRALRAKTAMVMTGTGVYRPFGGLPPVFNRSLIEGELRRHVGFSGLVVTDALETPALAPFAPVSQRAPKALRAGNDLLLVTYDGGADPYFRSSLTALHRGELSLRQLSRSLPRILTLRRQLRAVRPVHRP